MKAERAPLAAIPRFLVATEGRVHVVAAVDRNPARADAPREFLGDFDVFARDVAGKTVFGVVGDGDGFVVILISEDTKHRAEDFLTRDGHIVGHVGKDGGLDVVACFQPFGLAGAARDQRRAFADTGLDQRLNLVPLRLADDGADGGVALRIAGDHAFGSFLCRRLGLIHPPGGHEHAARRGAGLARIAHHGGGALRH